MARQALILRMYVCSCIHTQKILLTSSVWPVKPFTSLKTVIVLRMRLCIFLHPHVYICMYIYIYVCIYIYIYTHTRVHVHTLGALVLECVAWQTLTLHVCMVNEYIFVRNQVLLTSSVWPDKPFTSPDDLEPPTMGSTEGLSRSVVVRYTWFSACSYAWRSSKYFYSIHVVLLEECEDSNQRFICAYTQVYSARLW